MTARSAISAAAVLIGLLLGPAAAAAQKSALPERHKTWLDQEVAYIITPVEREVFLKLQSDRERDMFMEAFWKQRDPTPNSTDNEFKTEHYRRIQYANHFLGREAPKPGWRTDRGRIYIILGEPNDIQRFQGKSGVYNCEVWFYQGLTDKGLPAGFHVLFFQEGGHGEYRLYSPTSDGPMALLQGYVGSPNDYASAYEALREIDGILADVSLSLIPGDESTSYGRPSLASDMLVQRIETAPRRMIEEKYARKFLEYKDIVEVEYSANYLDSESLVKIVREPSGTFFVHYAIEPRRLSVNVYEKKYYTTLKVNGSVTTMDGRLVHQFDKSVEIDMPEDRMQALSRQPFTMHDLFPLVPGEYRFSVLVKNEASKEFTTLDEVLRVPAAGEGVVMTRPLLGYATTRPDPSGRKLRPFQFGDLQVSCQPNRVFATKDRLILAFQLLGLTGELRSAGEIRFALLREDGTAVRETTRKTAQLPDLPTVIQEFELADLPPAHYRVRVSFVAGGNEIVGAAEEFDLTFAPEVARPWVHSRVLAEAGDPIYEGVLGAQLFNLGRFAEAREKLERLNEARPGVLETVMNLARVHLALDDAAAAAVLLAPHLDESAEPSYDLLFLAGEAHRRNGAFEPAVGLFDRTIRHFGVNAALLNALGDCYAGLGRTEEAIAVLEKSLQLSPDQPETRTRLEDLRKKR